MPSSATCTAGLLRYMDANNRKLLIHATLLVITPEQQKRREAGKALHTGEDPMVQGKALSDKMQAANDFLAFIGVTPTCIDFYKHFENNNSIGLASPLVDLWNKGKGHCASSELQSIARRNTSQNITKFQKAMSTTASALGFTIKPDTIRPMVNGKQGLQTVGLQLGMDGHAPPLIGACLVWSDLLQTKVRVRDWESTHRKHAEDTASYQLVTWEEHVMEDALEATATVAAMPDPAVARREMYDGHVIDSELTRLKALPADRITDKEKRNLSFLTKLDEARHRGGGPLYTRYRDVTYDKPRGMGRRYASGPCNQQCSKELRIKLGQWRYHDIDIVNCHPMVLFNYADKHGLHTPLLLDYIQTRDAVLQKIADFYGLSDASLCKFAVLILLNGGSVEKWTHDSGCTRHSGLVALELQEMKKEFEIIRDHMLDVTFKSQTDAWKELLGKQAQQRLTNAHEELAKVLIDADATPADKADAKNTYDKARWKSGSDSIRRSCFSIRTHELEDELLAAVDESLRNNGWVVSSLIFDGVMVEDRPDANIESAMRDAEAAVKNRLKYKHFQLLEKKFFNATAAATATTSATATATATFDGGVAGNDMEVDGICGEGETMPMETDDDYDNNHL